MTSRFIRAALATTMVVAAASASAEIKPADVVWEDEIAIPASLTGVPGDPLEGAKVLSARSLGNCVACHENSAMPDVAFQGNVGPALDGTGARWSEAELRGIVANAKRVFPDSMMPVFYNDNPEDFIRPGNAYTAKAYDPETFSTLLTAQQIEDVVAYLTTLTEY
ncbi:MULTISPECIES: sulfur oxidation c-type cytochrome SoxX [Roseinatronobacter]|uniref:Sulfur oxidation c-type cytochrome SoxX n=1 Tax=Roseinatronobacter domitianus TaxID=2940293 RepID=A0ABT0M078_9RHOB|nr:MULTISPECIES: sulfur oxidation c-type cytochrome SoxX [Roseibaca]MCL1627998.1 sulfur oxidation c-type cytochrome SoxX [Roseibaca domitiana]